MQAQGRLDDLLGQIYTDRAVRERAQSLVRALLKRYAELPLNEACRGGMDSPVLSERDVFLITYGNSLQGEGTKTPLSVLRHFAERRLSDFISYIHILPFFPYSSDDGFSVIDYRQVNPKLGSWPDIEALGAHFKLAFDLVINHASSKGHWFRGFLDGEPGFAGWFITRPEKYDWSTVVRPRTHPLFTAFTLKDGTVVQVWTTFSPDQVDLDFSNPYVLTEMLDIFLDYVRKGARIVRLDAIAYLWKEDGHACLHHPRTHAVVRLFRAVVDALGLDVLLLSETNVPHAENISYFGEGDEAHMVYNFALPPLVIHAFAKGEVSELSDWARELRAPSKGSFLNFLASHDGIGLTPVHGLVDGQAFLGTLELMKARGCLISYKATASGAIPYELNASWFDAVSDHSLPEELRIRAHLASHAIAASLDGMPAVYIHSLLGTPNWMEGPRVKGYNRAINRQSLSPKAVEAELENPSSRASRCMEGMKNLYTSRGLERALAPGEPSRILSGPGAVFAVVRGSPGGRLLCAVNASEKPADLALGPDLELSCTPYDPTTRKPIAKSGAEGGRILKLEPYGVVWLPLDPP